MVISITQKWHFLHVYVFLHTTQKLIFFVLHLTLSKGKKSKASVSSCAEETKYNSNMDNGEYCSDIQGNKYEGNCSIYP